MTEPNAPSGAEQVRALYEQAESRAADAFEELVSKPSFGVLLARSAENVAAISRLSSDLADLVLRNLRVAGRADVTRLARQLQRTEDKLERLLQEVEELRDELARALSANRSGVAGTDTLPRPPREAASASPAGIGTVPKPTRGPSAVGSHGAETDTEPKRTRGAS
jgi:acyl transferase domain-containing protein